MDTVKIRGLLEPRCWDVYDLYSKGQKELEPYHDLFTEFFPEKIAW